MLGSVLEASAPTVVALHGRLGFESAPRIKEALTRACEAASGRIVVDCAGAELQDTTVLGVVLAIARRERESDARLLVRGASPTVRRILERFGPVDADLDFDAGEV
jgi:anti-anti-sigma factor